MNDDLTVQEIIDLLPHLSDEELREVSQQIEYRRGYLLGVRRAIDDLIEKMKDESRQLGIPDRMLNYDILSEAMYQEALKKPMPPYDTQPAP